MKHFVLVVNAGSSSIKFSVYRIAGAARLEIEISGQVDGLGTSPKLKITQADGVLVLDELPGNAAPNNHEQAFDCIRSWLLNYLGNGKLIAIGHRVVHGGTQYNAPVVISDQVINDLDKLSPLAPLHQPHNLLAIRAFRRTLPAVPQVACFDTAFHRTQPEIAQYFGLPRRFFAEGVRRFGFHGLSFEYAISTLPAIGLDITGLRLIVAHLGSGASLCAIRNGSSIAATMGFSPLDGLLMGTRCGSLDPGVLLYLADRYRMGTRELEHLLYHESGLLGISGLSNDMRTLLACDHVHAREAVDLFVYRIVREIGSLTAALGGLDALVFTGGIGENSHEIRERICLKIQWLGLELDSQANRAGDVCISQNQSKVSAWLLKTNENEIIAKHTMNTLTEVKS